MEAYRESLHKSDISRYRKQCAARMTGKVLDVGGGLGCYLPYFNADHVTVMDIDAETLSYLQHDDKVVADALNMPFADNTYDNIWACAVCQYFDIDKFIAEAKRVLKKNPAARILILVPNANSPWDTIKRLLGMKTWADQAGIFKQYSAAELRKYGKVTGEIRFLPFESLFRNVPSLWHTLVLEVCQDEG